MSQYRSPLELLPARELAKALLRCDSSRSLITDASVPLGEAVNALRRGGGGMAGAYPRGYDVHVRGTRVEVECSQGVVHDPPLRFATLALIKELRAEVARQSSSNGGNRPVSHRTPTPARSKRPGPHDHLFVAYPSDQRFQLCSVPGCGVRRYRPVAEEPAPPPAAVVLSSTTLVSGGGAAAPISAGDRVRIKAESQAAYPQRFWNLVGIAESVTQAKTKVVRWLVDYGEHMAGRYRVREEHLERADVQQQQQQPAPAEQRA